MQPHDEPNQATKSGSKHDNNRYGLTKADAEVVGAICLVLVVVGAGAGYYAFNYITKDSERMKFWVGFMFSFAALMVIAVQSVIYVRQAGFMKQQSKAMGESVERTDKIIEKMQLQLEAMEDQVEFAGKQAELTAKQISLMIENERAYIGVRRIKLVGLNETMTSVAARITFRNGGKSPAFGFKYYGVADVGAVGSTPKPFIWKEITPDIKRDFIPGREDRSVLIPYFGFVDKDAVFGGNPTHELFIDGEARYTTLGGKEIALCFGGTYDPSQDAWETRYQYERETVTPGTAYLKLSTFAPEVVTRPAKPDEKADLESEDEGKNPK